MSYGIRKGKSSRGKKKSPGKTIAFLLLITVFSVLATVAIWNGISFLIDSYTREYRYDRVILEAGRRNGIDPCLVKAVIWRESKFRVNTRGSKGEIGLMQVMPESAAADWARLKGYAKPSRGALYDPELNIEIGSWYLSRALHRWSRFEHGTELALCEYNAGLRRAKEWMPEKADGPVDNRITITSTKRYVSDIMKRYAKYRKEWNIVK